MTLLLFPYKTMLPDLVDKLKKVEHMIEFTYKKIRNT